MPWFRRSAQTTQTTQTTEATENDAPARRHLDFPMGAHGDHLGKLPATDCLATGEASSA
ncbi:MAG: hypothetical protein ABI274_00045 [Ktedonobacterales bacterium]